MYPRMFNSVPSVVEVEKNGFIEVPLDYSDLSGSQLKIFYRYIAADGRTINGGDKPTLVVINGGPGLPSGLYRSYDYDYSQPFEQRTEDRLKNLTRWFNVLIMDQRGTAGKSTNVSLDLEDLNYSLIAKYYSADSIARDQERVIQAVLGEEPSFYMLGQSFGGIVGFQYLLQPEIKQRPKAIIFSCPSMPFRSSEETAINRRNSQLKLNEQLRKKFPDIAMRVETLRGHLLSLGIDPANTNILWSLLGRSKDGLWETELIEQMNRLMEMDKTHLEKYIAESIGTPNLLNYILTPSNLLPGMTDTNLSKIAMAALPFEDWMFDEFATYLAVSQGDSLHANIIRRIDADPPAGITFGDPQEVKLMINAIPVMFIFGGNDAMTPTQSSIDHMLAHFYIDGKTKYNTFDGGHQAVFTEEGAQYISNWVKNLNDNDLEPDRSPYTL